MQQEFEKLSLSIQCFRQKLESEDKGIRDKISMCDAEIAKLQTKIRRSGDRVGSTFSSHP